jgi:predicted KAP-like P-loop ATPase
MTVQRTYSTDQPIVGKDQDRFNRWPFAERIAATIARGRDPASLVIGLYGPWGDGKTSTLVMMEQALAQYPDVVVFRFNPWQFGGEEQLLRGFFDSLADVLGESLKGFKEAIGGILEKYGGILSAASVHMAHGSGVTIDPGKGVAALGRSLSSIQLQQLRVRLEKILRDSGKQVVILVDDIDRLDRSEIHAIFKLIKLSASFEHTTYVLAFDDEMVAAALGEKYGSGDIAAGRAFLEKIIQVPLHLPPAEITELRQVAFDELNAILEQSQIGLTREQVEQFFVSFQGAIQDQMKTPRQAKRLANAISFALPILKGEANPVDVMLIEATRVIFPKLYAAIRDNPDLFLVAREYGEREEDRQKRLLELIDPALNGLGDAEKNTVRRAGGGPVPSDESHRLWVRLGHKVVARAARLLRGVLCALLLLCGAARGRWRSRGPTLYR